MITVELLLLSVSLAMDAFSVSLCKGVKLKEKMLKNALIIAVFFGAAQAIMPLLGYLLSYRFIRYIEKFDHYIAFGILAFIGVKMIIDAIRGEDSEVSGAPDFKELVMLAVATSLDALAVGVTFAMEPRNNVIVSCSAIGAVTLLICFAGVYIGHFFGSKSGKPATIVGGCVLILTGLKILIEGIVVI